MWRSLFLRMATGSRIHTANTANRSSYKSGWDTLNVKQSPSPSRRTTSPSREILYSETDCINWIGFDSVDHHAHGFHNVALRTPVVDHAPFPPEAPVDAVIER